QYRKTEKRNVLIYGAGNLGILTKQSLLESDKFQYKVIGFVDDDLRVKGKMIEGVSVYLASDVLNKEFVEKKEIEEIIFAIQTINADRKREIIDECLALGLPIKTIPPVKKWINGQLSVKQIKNVDIEDLLGRDPIKLG